MVAQWNSRDNYRGGGGPPLDYNTVHPYDYPTWGYVILYLVVILGSLIGNGLFLLVIKKVEGLHRAVHFFFAAMAMRDLITTVFVVPFVMDQVVKLMEWTSGEALCKLYSLLDIGTQATHSFLLVFILVFLYIWYRKNQGYVDRDGNTVIRKNKAHKWVIPLAWVLGLGLAIPAGALAFDALNMTTGRKTCSVWDGRRTSTSNYWVQLSVVLVAFVLPLVLILFPTIALIMQLCGSREPKLDPPHNRSAATAVAMVVVWIGTRAPSEIYTMMKLFHQSSAGIRIDQRWGSPYMATAFETDMIIGCIVYVSCVIHPILYFAINPIYRQGLKKAWKDLYCNKSAAERQQMAEQKRKYPAGHSRTPIIKDNRAGSQRLVGGPQPQIMRAGSSAQQYYPYPQGQSMGPGQTGSLPQGVNPAHLQPLLHAQQTNSLPMNLPPPPHPGMSQHEYHLWLLQQQHIAAGVFDSSFERLSPQLPPVFEFDGLKYIDTSRVQPRVGYSPEKTPDRTPEVPRYKQRPFGNPVQGGQQMEMTDMSRQRAEMVSPPLATSEPKFQPQQQNEDFQLEKLNSSPGNTLRTRRLREDLDETVELLSESPGQKLRRKNHDSNQGSEGYSTGTNGTGVVTSRPTSPLDRPGSRQSGVEIVITGRTRSRTDLCPDVPRSKFEHSV